MSYDIGKSNWPAPGFVPGLGALSKRQLEAAARMQQAFIETIEDFNRAWLARVQSQVSFASELAAARSITDVTVACEQCTRRQFEMVADDGRKMLVDGEKLLTACTRSFPDDPIGLSS